MKCTFAAMAVVALAQAQQGWEVTGTVTYNAKPAKGLLVIIEGPMSRVVETDGQGGYKLKGEAPGLYSLRVQAEDNTSAPRPRSVSLTAGMRLKVDFPIPKGGILAGRVLDENKKPVSGVIVQALLKSVNRLGVRLFGQNGDKTNDLGEYRIPNLPDGTYLLAVTSKPPATRKRTAGPAALGRGYPLVVFYPGGPVLDGAAALEVRSGSEQSGLDLTLRKEATRCISFQAGGVLEEPNKPHASNTVSVEPWLGAIYNGAGFPGGGEVAKNGSYSMCGLAAGEYRLVFRSEVDEPLPGNGGTPAARLHVDGYLSEPVNLDKQDVDLGTLQIPAPQEVHGTLSVQDAAADTKVPAGMRVVLVPKETDFMRLANNGGFTAVQPDGNFSLPHVFQGDYAVRMDGLPAGHYAIEISQLGRSVRDGGFRPGNGDLQVTLGADGASLSGRVLSADDAIVPDATVLLVPSGGGRPLSVQSDQTGAFRFAAGVAPGEYRLAAVADLLEGQRQDTATISRLAADGMELKLSARESRTIDLKK